MKVDMNIEEGKYKLGMFSSVDVFYVNIRAEFTEEEKVALKKSGAMDKVFLRYQLHPKDTNLRNIYDGDEAFCTVQKLIAQGGCKPYYLTRVDAQNALEEIEGLFRVLKQHATVVNAPQSRSLEL